MSGLFKISDYFLKYQDCQIKSIHNTKTETLFTKTKMNNQWNMNFL